MIWNGHVTSLRSFTYCGSKFSPQPCQCTPHIQESLLPFAKDYFHTLIANCIQWEISKLFTGDFSKLVELVACKMKFSTCFKIWRKIKSTQTRSHSAHIINLFRSVRSPFQIVILLWIKTSTMLALFIHQMNLSLKKWEDSCVTRNHTLSILLRTSRKSFKNLHSINSKKKKKPIIKRRH